jgi:Leucine-rich repeat (LRR) protein
MRLVVAAGWSFALLVVAACGSGTSSLAGGTGGRGGAGTCISSSCNDGSGGANPSGGSGGGSSPDGGNSGDDSGGRSGAGGSGGQADDDAGGSSAAGGGAGTTIDGGGPIDGAIADSGGPSPPTGDASPCQGEIFIPDLNVQGAVQTAINKPPPFLGEDVAKVTELSVTYLESSPLTSLRGLECFTSLRSFITRGPDLRSLGSLDLSPLAGLPALISFNITADRDIDYGAPFAYLDLSPLGRVPTISSLTLHTNAVASIASLALLPNLSIFFLDSDTLTDLSPIAGATKLVGRTIVSGKRITDITPLADAMRASNAKSLYIGPTAVGDLSPFTRATTLVVFSVTGSPIADMAPLAALPNLTNLSVIDGALATVAVGPSVTILDVSGNRIADWSPLASSRVHTLRVRRNGITDLAPFTRMPALDNGGLDVSENPYDCMTQSIHIWALQQRGVQVKQKQECQP